MPTAKRASMREGPLAALFRKTAEDVGARPSADGERPAAAGSGHSPAGRESGHSPAAESGQSPPDEEPGHSPARAEPAQSLAGEESAQPPAGGASGQPPAGGGSGQPPAAAASEQFEASESSAARAADELPVERAAQEHAVRTPQERLRSAFAADIPHNLMEPPVAQRPPAAPEPAHDVYARTERIGEAYPPLRPVGTPVLKVVGIGGAGVNAINRMVEAEITGVEFLAINTDLQSLQSCAAHDTLHIGDAITRGLGSGSNPDLGRQAAREEHDRIKAMLRGSDMVFITAGAGGGTGTGAAPVIAQIARELGALTVGIVTRPFQFEGTRRRDQAEVGINELAGEVDTLIVVPNNRLLTVLERNTSMVEAFRVADDVLRQGVQGISDLVTLPGLINLDFADVRTIMSDAGNALLGIGMGAGERRAIDAAEKAVASPLLETSMEGARAILLSITGGNDLSLWEVNEAAKAVGEAAHPEANIIFGAMVDDKLDDQVWVTVVATGYGPGRTVRHDAERTPARGRSDSDSSLREPRGEPRVTRVRRSSATDFEVPEFIPRR